MDEIRSRAEAGEFRINCKLEYEPLADEERCFIGPITLANKKVYAFSLVYRNNLVTFVDTQTTDEDVAHIETALEAKFGAPNVSELVKQNAYGAESHGISYIWDDGDRVLTFESIGNKKTEGRIRLTHKESLKIIQKLRDEAAINSVDDL